METIAVIGLGSMGKRRIRLLKNQLGKKVIGIDTNIERLTEVTEIFHIPCYSSIELALNNHNIFAAVVSTSPLSHATIIHTLLDKKIHVFSEINLTTEHYNELIELAYKKQCILFLSSTMLYRQEVSYISDITRGSQNMNYSYHIGQYLPDWHPWESYKNFFVANSKTNACREILAIELPWLQAVFGDITDCKIVRKKTTSLELDYLDTYFIILEHTKNNHGSFIVDITCRPAVHSFTLFSENLLLQWNGTPETLLVYNHITCQMENPHFTEKIIKDPHYADNILENDYLEELKAFFDKIEHPLHQYYNFEDDLKTLTIIDKMES